MVKRRDLIICRDPSFLSFFLIFFPDPACPRLLVDDGVNGNGGLANLTVTDDELALSTADGHEGVDSLETGHHGLVHGLAHNDTGSLELHAARGDVGHGTLAVNGVAETIHHTAEETAAGGHLHNSTCE